jgi:hypothetical protein
VVTREDATTPDGRIRRARGSVGVVVEPPTDAAGVYRVRFPDGAEVALVRRALSIHKAQRESSLPELPSGRAALDDLLVRIRLASFDAVGQT